MCGGFGSSFVSAVSLCPNCLIGDAVNITVERGIARHLDVNALTVRRYLKWQALAGQLMPSSVRGISHHGADDLASDPEEELTESALRPTASDVAST
jgi:hypothetical protein